MSKQIVLLQLNLTVFAGSIDGETLDPQVELQYLPGYDSSFRVVQDEGDNDRVVRDVSDDYEGTILDADGLPIEYDFFIGPVPPIKA